MDQSHKLSIETDVRTKLTTKREYNEKIQEGHAALGQVTQGAQRDSILAVSKIGTSGGNNPSLRKRLGFKAALLGTLAMISGKQWAR